MYRFASHALSLIALLGIAACERTTQSDAPVAAVSASAPAPEPGGALSATPSGAPQSGAAPAREAEASDPLSRPYHVLFIMVDALRADMPWVGYPRDIAPRMTELSRECALYPRAYSLSSYTAKSVIPALAGKYPSEMKRDGYFFTRWMPENVLITELAQQAGHRTISGQGHGYFLPGMGTDQGYDDHRLLPGTFLDNKGVFDVTSEKLNRLAKEMLADAAGRVSQDRRFFAYFHFLDPHYQYFRHQGHPDFGNGRRDLYDNEVHYTDKWLGDLVDWVRAQPWSDETAIIVTSDHGEGFGEHNHYRHSYEIWEALVRVPLMICIPKVPPRRIAEPRGHIDLAPTIADLMGITPLEPWRGKSLLPEVLGGPVEPRPVVTEMPRCDLVDRRRAVISGDYKLIAFGDDRSYQLYNVTRDFREEEELSAKEPEKLEAMKALYQKVSAEIPVVRVVGSAPLKGAPPGRGW